MSLETRVLGVIQAIGADVKALKLADGNLANLSTTDKTNLVNSINELYALIGAASNINDNAPSSSTTAAYSASKITSLVAALKTEILGGASSAYDTLVEIQAFLQADATALTNLLTAVGSRVRFDAAQTLTTAELVQVNANLGIGNYDRDFTADYVTAKS